MATIRKILTNSLTLDSSCVLIAMHSDLEDYAMAYAINGFLGTRLRRSAHDLDLPNQVSFPVFEWKDVAKETVWTLLGNESIQGNNTPDIGLFKEGLPGRKYRLIPEHKEVDYFLKIETDESGLEGTLLKSILSVTDIITAYPLQMNKLKSKNNLIFE